MFEISFAEKSIKPFFQNSNISIRVISLDLCFLHFDLQLFKRLVISTFTLQQELQNLLDLFRLKLLMNRVKILWLVLPEFDFLEWVRVSLFECLLWLEFKDVFYLFGPHNNTALEDVGLVLFSDLCSLGYLIRWYRKSGLALHLTYCYIGLCQVVIKLFY